MNSNHYNIDCLVNYSSFLAIESCRFHLFFLDTSVNHRCKRCSFWKEPCDLDWWLLLVTRDLLSLFDIYRLHAFRFALWFYYSFFFYYFFSCICFQKIIFLINRQTLNMKYSLDKHVSKNICIINIFKYFFVCVRWLYFNVRLPRWIWCPSKFDYINYVFDDIIIIIIVCPDDFIVDLCIIYMLNPGYIF